MSVEVPRSDQNLGNGKEPGVVFLLGWTGSALKNLKGYGDFYYEQGEAVVKYCPSPSLIYKLNARKDYEYLSQKLMNTLREKELDNRPLFFHCFSNGGAYMYHALTQQLLRNGKDSVFRGVILDSAPAITGFRLLKGSVSEVTPGNALAKNIVGLLGVSWGYWILAYNLFVDALHLRDLRKSEDYRFFLHRSLCAHPNLGPQMCLFSKTDMVTHYKHVQRFIRKRRELGVDIEATLWDDSKHCRHFLQHKEQYLTLMKAFFEKCVKEPRRHVHDSTKCATTKSAM